MNSSDALAVVPVCTSLINSGAVTSGPGASGGLMLSARATSGDDTKIKLISKLLRSCGIDVCFDTAR